MYYQLLAHLVGDYILQSGWMANNKTKRNFPALVHAITYTLPFLFLTQTPMAIGIIFGTHFLIDRFRIAHYVCLARNYLRPIKTWSEEQGKCPDWLNFFLLVAVDNTMHLIINAMAIANFG